MKEKILKYECCGLSLEPFPHFLGIYANEYGREKVASMNEIFWEKMEKRQHKDAKKQCKKDEQFNKRNTLCKYFFSFPLFLKP